LKPGRVVTLIADAVGQSVTPGILFRLVGASQIAAAMKHLYYRECENGYSMDLVTVSIGDVIDAATTPTTVSEEIF
jgi:cation transport regulator ChaC